MIWVDDTVLEEKQAPKITMTWSCDCRNTKKGKYTSNVAGVFYPTKVDSEGLCTHCKHYAIKMNDAILANNTKIRKSVRNR